MAALVHQILAGTATEHRHRDKPGLGGPKNACHEGCKNRAHGHIAHRWEGRSPDGIIVRQIVADTEKRCRSEVYESEVEIVGAAVPLAPGQHSKLKPVTGLKALQSIGNRSRLVARLEQAELRDRVLTFGL
jgi:hypothetical protein